MSSSNNSVWGNSSSIDDCDKEIILVHWLRNAATKLVQEFTGNVNLNNDNTGAKKKCKTWCLIDE